MPYRFNTCPHCEQKITFWIDQEDINTKKYPAPVYIHHKINSCGKVSTFYVDSLLRVSFSYPGKKPGGIKTLPTIKASSLEKDKRKRLKKKK